MCAEFWIQNKDINFFSTKAVTIVRKRFLSHYFFNLFLLFSTSCIKAIKLKLTCYCIKNSMFFLMFLMKKLHQQRLQSFFYNNIVFSLNDSIDGVSFNIDLSIIENKIDASTINVNIIDAIEVGHNIWNKDTKNQDFIANILTGNYTITAFIDTNNNGEINIWEAQGSYSITVAIDDNTNVYHTTLHDPKDQYTPQFIEHTGSYKAWFDNYPTIGQPDEDFDQDGYKNFQEYLNGTDPETTNIAYVYNHYDPAFDQDNSDISNQYQVISTNPLVPKARPGEAFLVDINYTTSDNNPETTGLGLAIHFNSHFMEFAGFSNVLTETLAIHISDLTINVRDENNEGIPNDHGFSFR
jgi:hypothetical protein